MSVSGSFEKFGAEVSGVTSERSKWSSDVSQYSSPTLVTLAILESSYQIIWQRQNLKGHETPGCRSDCLPVAFTINKMSNQAF